MKTDTVPLHVRVAYRQHKAAINSELFMEGEPDEFALMVRHWIAAKAIAAEYPDVLFNEEETLGENMA